jgi:phospholipid/cholesterol/gamma-HCH transport system substrate-binding protein
MVGVVSIGALIALAWLMMSFGELERFTNPRYRMALLSSNAAGLRRGAGVEYNGVPIGVIDKVSAGNDPQHPVRVEMLISQHVSLPKDMQVSVSAPLIGGSSMLRFADPVREPGATIEMHPKDGKGEITADLAGGGMFDSITAALDERMKPLLDSLEKFNRLADTYTAVGENMNALLLPQGEAALEAGEPPNLRTAVAKINKAIDEATEGLRLAKEWLNDEQLRTNVREAVSKAHELIDQATTAVDHYTKLAVSLQTDADELTKNLMRVTDQMAATLEDVRTLARKANAGEGTIGQMLNNPDLYNSLTEAAMRLERTLVEVQLFIQKVKAEGLPMKLF